jgi:hypothetical protein
MSSAKMDLDFGDWRAKSSAVCWYEKRVPVKMGGGSICVLSGERK